MSEGIGGAGIDRAGATNAGLVANAQVDTAVKATLGGQKLVKVASLSQVLQDFQEEVSFGHGERVEQDDLAEDAVEDRARKMREQLVQKVQKAYQSSEAGEDQREKLQSLLSKAHNGGYGEEDLLDDLQQGSRDRGEVFSMLLELEKMAPAGSPEAATIGKAIDAAALRWENQLLAAANTLPDALEFSERTGIEQDKLQRSYQDSVVDYSSVIGSLASLAREHDSEQLAASVEFLEQASLADLAATPSSLDKERLNQIMLELQGFKIMNTISEGVNESHERAAAADAKLAKIERNWLLASFLSALDNPTVFELNIKESIETGEKLQNKVLLLQDLRQVIDDVPEHYFRSDQKQRSVTPWRHEIDRLIDIEAEQA